MRLNDTLSGLLLIVVGGAVVVYARTFPPAVGQVIGPGFFPMLVGAGLAACGAGLVWAARKIRGARVIELEEWMRQPRLMVNGGFVIGALMFYAVVVETVGFFITAFVILAGLFLAFGVRRRWIAPLAAGVTLGLHLSFYSLLRVPLPWGWLEGMAW